jgi:hypothetical protein
MLCNGELYIELRRKFQLMFYAIVYTRYREFFVSSLGWQQRQTYLSWRENRRALIGYCLADSVRSDKFASIFQPNEYVSCQAFGCKLLQKSRFRPLENQPAI